jgi:D-3-phosphoglycerate dehydrogenase / 2-oxoglutarate reductase
MTKIVVHTGGPGRDLTQERESLDRPGIELRQVGPCRTPDAVLEAVRDADVALCGGEPYTGEVFAGATQLKMVIRYGVGVDTIDLPSATEHGVVVGYLPDFCLREVANHALMLLLACAKKVRQLDDAMRNADWNAGKALLAPMGPIHGETVGLIAFGNIAREMARRCQVLDMHVIASDPFVDPSVMAEAGVESVSLDELAARSDYVSCHLPLGPKTRGFIDASFFSLLKPTAYFINTSRGAVVNEADLIACLGEHRIAGAGLDVFESEPIGSDHPFCSMPHVILTPHTASYSCQTMETQRRRIGRDALSVLEGGLPDFVANPEVLAHRRV